MLIQLNLKLLDLHSCIVSDADPAVFLLIFQIQESRSDEELGMFGLRIAILAFTSSLDKTQNFFNVESSAPSQTIAIWALLYTRE